MEPCLFVSKVLILGLFFLVITSKNSAHHEYRMVMGVPYVLLDLLKGIILKEIILIRKA